MYSECEEVAENIFSVLTESTIKYLQFSNARIRVLVSEQMQDESDTIINNVTESLTRLINAKELTQCD